MSKAFYFAFMHLHLLCNCHQLLETLIRSLLSSFFPRLIWENGNQPISLRFSLYNPDCSTPAVMVGLSPPHSQNPSGEVPVYHPHQFSPYYWIHSKNCLKTLLDFFFFSDLILRRSSITVSSTI